MDVATKVEIIYDIVYSDLDSDEELGILYFQWENRFAVISDVHFGKHILTAAETVELEKLWVQFCELYDVDPLVDYDDVDDFCVHSPYLTIPEWFEN